ncbi:hypothetical protein ACQV5M_19570, partial [Leptospira sp. SA-E8]|uniref:hypothetical protein n=1 Tax=Leptospira sp. SA-E8 TaxID=3422259 RepID=UPI003EB965C8
MKLRDLFHWLAMCVSAWVLAGCTVFTHEMTDFKGLSVAYGWLDISEVNGNLITKLYLKQTQPKTDEPFQGMGVQKFNKGFIYY